jgi:hypothetical protein
LTASESQQTEGLLAVYVDVPPELKPDFEKWFDTDHLPAMRELPGFVNAMRFDGVEGSPNTLALYELTSLEVLGTPEYLALSQLSSPLVDTKLRAGLRDYTRLAYRLRTARVTPGSGLSEAPYVVATRLFAKPGHESAIRAWLDEEHSRRQLTVPGALAYYGCEPLEPPFHFLNLWGIETLEVQSSAAWAEASKTPWRDEVMQGRDKILRGVYRRQ